jgi:hypothetical protein
MMITLSRWWRSRSHSQSGVGQGSPDDPSRKKQHLATRSAGSLEADTELPRLCERCRRLQLLSHVERPRVPSPTDPIGGFMVANIDRGSIDIGCALCTQFGQFLPKHDLVYPSLAARQPRSFELWRHHTSQYEPIKTYFMIQYQGADRKQRIFLTEPMILGGFSIASIEAPFSSPLLQVGPEVSTGTRLSDPAVVDINIAKEWNEWCNVNHRHVCGKLRQGALRPDRLIDCERRELCHSDEPYVCLSYVWGPTLPDQESVAGTLPHEMPRTISDAIDITLKVGLRYLWVDRYCISQNNEAERHNIIRNMDAICKSVQSEPTE